MKFIDDIPAGSPGDYIEHAIASVQESLGVFITIHDRHGFLRAPDGSALLRGRNLHTHPYCVRNKFTPPIWETNCRQDCYRQANQEAFQRRIPFIKSCWKGVYELVVPVFREDLHILTVFAGAFRTQENHFPYSLRFNRKQTKLYNSLPLLDEDKMKKYSTIIYFMGQGILHHVDEAARTPEKAHGRQEEIENFLRYNTHKNIKLNDLAKHLCLSPSRTSHLVRELTGRSFQELLKRERLLRARALLISTNQSLEETAAAVGINNVYYFSRIFKQLFGIPPGKFKRMNLAQEQ